MGHFCLTLFGSALLGIILTVVMAMVVRRSALKKNPLMEQGMFFVFLYLPYMVGEICYMSGIVTTLSAGLAARKFVHPNMTYESQEHIQSFMRMLAGLAETAAFLDLGMTCMLFR